MISPMLSQLDSFSAEEPPNIWRPYAIVSLILLITFLAWDSTAWDMQLATMWGEPSGFVLRDHWWMASLEPVGSRWRWRSLLSSRSRLDRLRVHGGLLWSATKQCTGRYEVAACGRVHRIYLGNFTTNARRAFHESHPLDSLVVLDCGLVKSFAF